MSYIRGTSNPEQLYIWVGSDGTNISAGPEDPVIVNSLSFHKLLKKSFESGGCEDPITVDNLTIQEVFIPRGRRVDYAKRFKDPEFRKAWVKQNPGMKIPANWEPVYKHKPQWHQSGDFKYRLTIKLKDSTKVFYMWGVTWWYIVMGAFQCNQIAGHRKTSRRYW